MKSQMKKDMICIVCPNSCSLCAQWEWDDEGGAGGNLAGARPADPAAITVTGNKCPKGRDFAIAELTAPMRTISTTAATCFPQHPVVPVRVSCDIPKEKIFDVMREINRVTVDFPARRGDVIIGNVLGLGADVIVTSDVLYEAYAGRTEGGSHE